MVMASMASFKYLDMVHLLIAIQFIKAKYDDVSHPCFSSY